VQEHDGAYDDDACNDGVYDDGLYEVLWGACGRMRARQSESERKIAIEHVLNRKGACGRVLIERAWRVRANRTS
jgi:hypothetical protein